MNVVRLKLGHVVDSGLGVKAINEQNGIITFRMTSKAIDRDGEVVLPKGGIFTNFAKNPRFLWSHNHNIPSLGKVLVDAMERKEEYIDSPVHFDIDGDPFAEMIFKKYVNGFLDANSIGFLVMEYGEKVFPEQRGKTIAKWELIEDSAVNIPSNPEALRDEYKRSKSKSLKDYEMPYYEGIKKMYEQAKADGIINDPLTVYCNGIIKTVSHTSDSLFAGTYTSTNGTGSEQEQEESVTPENDPVDDSVEKNILSMMAGNPIGSCEWLMGKLQQRVFERLVQDDKAMVKSTDMVILGATYPGNLVKGAPEKEVIACALDFERDFEDDLCFRLKWDLDEKNQIVFTSEPEEVQLSLDIQARIYQSHGIEKAVYSLAPKDSSFDVKKAELRVREWAMNHAKNAHGEHDPDRHETLLKMAYDSTGNYLVCDVDSTKGQLQLHWKAIADAMLHLLGNPDVIGEERFKVYYSLGKLYAKFGKVVPTYISGNLDDEVAQKDDKPDSKPKVENDKPAADPVADDAVEDSTTVEVEHDMQQAYESTMTEVPTFTDPEAALIDALLLSVRDGSIGEEELTPVMVATLLDEMNKNKKTQ